MDVDGQLLLDRVRDAQEELGAGSADEALSQVTPLLADTSAALTAMGFLRRGAADKRSVLDAYCYARVTAILALESVGATEAVPRIRQLAAEARDLAGAHPVAWKVQSAAAEMLSRCGDGSGAMQAVASGLAVSADEPYLLQLRASITSMFPALRTGANTAPATPDIR